MSETTRTASRPAWFDRAEWARWADTLAIIVAISLPWSTSATSILLVIWLILLIPTLDFDDFLKTLATPAGGLPVAVWLLAIIGMLWADTPFTDQFAAVKGLHKLLIIPLCILQFQRSDKGLWVLGGFLASCTALLAVSWVTWCWPQRWMEFTRGVPVKDYIVQSGEFTICAFALTLLALSAWGKGQRRLALGCAVLSAIFLANIAFVATGRTSLLVYLALAALLGFRRFGWKGGSGFILVAGMLGSGALLSSPYLQDRLNSTNQDVVLYATDNASTSTGLRLEFWKKSIRFIAESPLIGHGTGSIGPLFRRAVVGDTGATAEVTLNVHNMTLQLGIQLGVLGVAVLYAMWLAHFWLFTYGSAGLASPASHLAAMIGAALVVQNVIGSLFLAYLADYSTGWLYVLGVGVVAGMMTRDRHATAVRA